jgi:hypothetical protein
VGEPARIYVLPHSKHCSGCQQVKLISEFTLRQTGARKGQPVSKCKKCNTDSYLARVARDPSLYRRVQWPSKLKRLYGLTVKQYYLMLEKQGGCCAICQSRVPCTRRHKNRGTEMFFIDHDHATGAVRGLLCNCCNRALGYLRDDPNLVERAMAYLRGE